MFAISPTDIDWFKFLRLESFSNEINFWTPTAWNVSKLDSGSRLYFMLKSPIRKIGGYGEFKEYKNTSIDQAWKEFGLKNGCASKREFTEKIDRYKQERSLVGREGPQSKIGCIVLTNSVFFDDEEFIDIKDFDIDFSRHIVKIKYFHQKDSLFNYEMARALPTSFKLLPASSEKLKKARFITERKGQGRFRAKLGDIYKNMCCISQEQTPELLEAAHIQPYIDENSNHIKNGLLLRIDLHKLFDNGLLYIDGNYRVHISPHVKSAYYHQFNGLKIRLPSNPKFYPSKEALNHKRIEYRNG